MGTIGETARYSSDGGAAVVSLDVHLISSSVSRAADALSHAALPWLLFALVDVIVLACLSGMSVSGISLVPAGLGVVDAAVILVLVQNGVGPGRAAAAMVLYRVFAFAFGLLAGWAAWFGHAGAWRVSACARVHRPQQRHPPNRRPRSRPRPHATGHRYRRMLE